MHTVCPCQEHTRGFNGLDLTIIVRTKYIVILGGLHEMAMDDWLTGSGWSASMASACVTTAF